MIRFFTNLDEAKPYVGSESWKGRVPAVGDIIEYRITPHFILQLAVVGITHNADGTETRVEMHMGRCYPGFSIADWMAWFERGKARQS
jgi:hypothetical protein